MAKLFIIAGHGNGDPGAIGNGYKEAERVRALAKKIKAYGGDNVIVGDTDKNWYAQNLINNKNIPSGSLVLELHMDCAAPEAKGAHIIIKSGLNPDKYDTALSNYVAEIFPGRAQKIVKRSDLANPNRAAAYSINYRLLECGFISNKGDVDKFNKNIDAIAIGILKAFGITPNTATGTTSAPVTTTKKIYRVQVGAFSDYDNAKAQLDRLQKDGYKGFIVEV